MASRPGGEADKFGNLFEGAWTVHQLLHVLAGSADAITVEDVGERGRGSEFTLTIGDHDEAHQVKLRDGTANGWTPRRLNAEDVLQSARHHVGKGRQFHFVSTIPAPKLEALADFARRSENLQAFLDFWLNKELEPEFTYLSGSEVYSSGQVAWQTLHGIYAQHVGEDVLRRMNNVLAAVYLEGAPPQAAALSLGDLAQQNLGVKLDAAAIEQRLGAYGLRLTQPGGTSATQDVAATWASWKRSIERTLLQPAIPREASAQLTDTLRARARQVTVVVGAAGAGKSAVLYQGVQQLEAEQWVVLGLRLDRLADFASTAQIGEHLDLGRSPVAALAAAAGSRPCVLVIDQLDAVSLASGRMPQRFDTVVDLVHEAVAFPQMRVLLACRGFDVDNDYRIRQLVADDSVARVDVHPLDNQQVDGAVRAMGLAAELLTAKQRELLASPFNLVLLSAIADQPDALSFTSANGLLAAYWDRKRRDCAERRQPAPRFAAVIGALANAMSERQQLTARISVLDAADLADDADVLASEHVLVRDGQRYAFFHEAFFDYAFARLWTERDQTLVEFLLADDQELFRRAQVRQILLYIRGDDSDRFVRETEAVLAHSEVRFHIKAAILAVVRALPDPSADEWQMLEKLMTHDA